MDTQDASLLASGQRVGLAVAPFRKELADFSPLQAADKERADLVVAIEAKADAQEAVTTGTTITKDEAREVMARAAAAVSDRAVAYALATGQLGLKRTLTLSYADVRYGAAAEDVRHVRDLVTQVDALSQQVRKDYRLTPALVQALADAADAFEAAGDAQEQTKAAPRLATLALPDLLTRLSAVLLLMKKLLAGQSGDTDPKFQWADLNAAFLDANKRRETAPERRVVTTGPRIVRTLPVHTRTGDALRLANTNYGPAYTLTVENRAAVPLLLWMAQKDGAKTTPHSCPAGAITTLTRADIGPATARYLTVQFGGAAGGDATVVVRRVV